jgi:hypothetical protein
LASRQDAVLTLRHSRHSPDRPPRGACSPLPRGHASRPRAAAPRLAVDDGRFDRQLPKHLNQPFEGPRRCEVDNKSDWVCPVKVFPSKDPEGALCAPGSCGAALNAARIETLISSPVFPSCDTSVTAPSIDVGRAAAGGATAVAATGWRRAKTDPEPISLGRSDGGGRSQRSSGAQLALEVLFRFKTAAGTSSPWVSAVSGCEHNRYGSIPRPSPPKSVWRGGGGFWNSRAVRQ